MKIGKLQYWLLLLIILNLYACSATKFIPDGEYLLDKVKIKSDITDYKTYELYPHVRQQPNYKMFALNKTTFQFYNLAGKDSSKWINRFLKKIGEAPVIFDSTLVEKTDLELKKFFINKGYLNVDVSSEIIRKDKKADVIYRITGNTPYRIQNFSSDIEDNEINRELTGGENGELLQRILGEPVSEHHSFVKEGILFDRNMLDAERERISNILRNRGYYAFNKDYIYYDADSALNSASVDLTLKMDSLEKLSPDGKINKLPHRKYYLNNVYIYLDYDPMKINSPDNYAASDSIAGNGYTIYYQGEKPSIRPKTLVNNNFINPQRPYSQLRENATYSAFSRLNALNNINIHFEEFVKNDTMKLDCYILTMPAKKQSVTFSVEGTNTEGDLGVASSVNYMHRNLFKGAETFNFKIRGAYEALTSSSNPVKPYLEIGGEASIHIPKFVFPFVRSSFSRRMRASTEFSLSYNHQSRPEYDRTLLSGGLKYIWQGRDRTSGRHQFDLLDIDYVYLLRIDSGFLDRLPANAQFFGYKDQFIVGTGYTYSKTTFDPAQKQRDAHSLRISLESAGNALYGFNKLLNKPKDESGFYKLFHTNFAQFVKTDIDYAKTFVLDRQNSIAWRIGGGVGFPYGNSEGLPFEKRYYSGGANSVRAWSVRELGPGAYQPVNTTTFFNQSGDIKLDFNLEFRTRFFWKLEAAAFFDAGNIWTIKNYPEQNDGQFKLNTFYKQIAMGYGLGLRLDMDFFLVRFDCGWKIYDPARRGKDMWTVMHPNFSNNWAWHVAVGYPF
ncbi:MAG: outer membrane protein assembly factor [Candidatus Symbiothrix sp.]|jgi:phosphopantetheine adenylyltransferase|nr:outer membrane protein assembly factor [Candidatus Symbiothrix sp.]